MIDFKIEEEISSASDPFCDIPGKTKRKEEQGNNDKNRHCMHDRAKETATATGTAKLAGLGVIISFFFPLHGLFVLVGLMAGYLAFVIKTPRASYLFSLSVEEKKREQRRGRIRCGYKQANE